MPNTYTHPTFAHWEREMDSARSEAKGKPLQNNTRLYRRGEDALAVRLHSTDVVTFYRDGTRRLSTGGWPTVTTRDRLRNYGSQYIVSERRDGWSDWYVLAEDDPRDPHPLGEGAHWRDHAQRSIPKPYTVADPGTEPFDDGVGCIADTREEYTYQGEEYVWLDGVLSRRGLRPTDFVVKREIDGKTTDHLKVRRSYVGVIEWTEQQQWGGEASERKQCPHCKAFQARHAAWRVAMHGERWGRNSGRGYAAMVEMLGRFGSREAWQDAYIEDFRATRALNAEIKTWRVRNLMPFYDGIEVTSQGVVPLKVKRAHCRQLERDAIEERKRARLHARVRRERARLQAKFDKQRTERRRVRRMVAEALACSLVASMEDKRAGFEGTREHRIAQALTGGDS